MGPHLSYPRVEMDINLTAENTLAPSPPPWPQPENLLLTIGDDSTEEGVAVRVRGNR